MSKKLKLGVWAFLLVFATTLFAGLITGITGQNRAQASTTAPDVTITSVKLQNANTITAVVNGKGVTFYDQNTSDTTYNYAPQDIDTSIFCGDGISGYGLNLDNPKAKSIKGVVNLGYWYDLGKIHECRAIPAAKISPNPVIIDNSGGLATTNYAWGSNSNIVSTDGKQTFIPIPGADSSHYWNDTSVQTSPRQTCEVAGIIITNGPTSGTRFSFNPADVPPDKRGSETAVPADLAKYLNNSQNCALWDTAAITITGQPPASSTFNGTACFDTNTFVHKGDCTPTEKTLGFQTAAACFDGSGNFVQSGNCPINGGTPPAGTVKKDCWSGGILSLEWVLCSALKGIDQGVSALDSIIVCELEFNTTQSSTCSSTQYLNDSKNGVEKAWASFRVIATALIVLIMLVAIFSQAINWGPLDAYTLRKAIPRLVAAVVFIQLSWFLVKFAIDFTNDLGHGIQALMYAPFGGNANMDLQSLLASPSSGTTGITAVPGLNFNLFEGLSLVAAGVGLAFLTAAGALALAVPVIVALLVGFFVLVARKVLIILCVILIPIALVAWILPGTKRYFDLWWKTFSRMLMMFPLIVALIAAGRIFAYISAGSPGQPKTPFAPNVAQIDILGHHLSLPLVQFGELSLVNYVLILVGYFGPYAILPKTLQWSGAALGAVGGALSKLGGRVSQPTSGYLNKQAGVKRQFQSDERAKRLSEGTSRFRAKDALLAGRYNIFRGRGGMKRGFEGTLAGGRKTAEEAAAAALVGSRFEQLNHDSTDPDEMTKVKAAKTLAGGGDIPELGLSGKDPTMRLHMLDQLATWGDWDKITDLRDSRAIPERIWQRFTAKNVGAIHQQAPHLSPLGSKADLSQSGYQEYTTWKDEAFKDLGRQLLTDNGKVRETKDPALTGTLVDIDPAKRPDQVIRAMGNIHGFLNDHLMEGRISAENRGDLEKTFAALPIDLGNADFRAKVTEHITTGMAATSSSKERRFAVSLTGALASRVAEAPVGGPDEANFRDYMDKLREQATTSPQAKLLHNELLANFQGHLTQLAQSAERDALAAGHDSAGVNAAVAAAVVHATAKKASLDGMGTTGTPLTPIP